MANEAGRSSTRGTDYQGLSRAQRIAASGKVLYSAYRQDQFADPKLFAVQLAAIFEQYEVEVVEYVTDARNHDALQCRHKFPPSIAEVREALDDEAARRARMLASASSPRPRLNRPYVPPPNHPGCRANVLVLSEAPQFATVKALVDAGELDGRDYEVQERGIRVALSVLDNLGGHVRRAGALFKAMNDDELRAHYGRREAELARERQRAAAAAEEIAP